jgi:hypothetical protein
MDQVEKYEFSLYELQKIGNALDVMTELKLKESAQTGDHDYELIRNKVQKMVSDWGTQSGKQYRIM